MPSGTSSKPRLAPSLSIYRGQSRTGIGEGPGKPIAHGEQYLRADPQLAGDGAQLKKIVPWLSLDAAPGDIEVLGDRLEAWSCFGYGDLRYVARLVTAGTYDRRPAYFAHGRAWPLQAFCGSDPGTHLARSEIFEKPWRDGAPGERVKEAEPSLVRPQQVAADSATAVRWLGHLLQARTASYPLVIAAPLDDFVIGGSLNALVSFARAALPSDLRDSCRIRIYTRHPELFLRHLGAHLVVVPETLAAQALASRRGATLLDREGRRFAGCGLEARARAYAESVLERALRIPAGLAPFSERFASRRSGPGLPDADEVRMLQVIYNLAFAIAGTEQRRGDLLRNYLFKKARELGPLPWDRLVDAEEWARFPRDAVFESIRRPSSDLDSGQRALQRELEQAASVLGLVPNLTQEPL